MSEPIDTIADILPESMEENTIKGMKINEIGYTVPWAMFADENRRLYINGSYTISIYPRGTCHMKIKKLSDRVIVERSTIKDEKYTPHKPMYVGATEKDYIPVVLI